jgi:hypothetical protein
MARATVTNLSQLAAHADLPLATRMLAIDLIEKYLQYPFSNARDFLLREFVAGFRFLLEVAQTDGSLYAHYLRTISRFLRVFTAAGVRALLDSDFFLRSRVTTLRLGLLRGSRSGTAITTGTTWCGSVFRLRVCGFWR